MVNRDAWKYNRNEVSKHRNSLKIHECRTGMMLLSSKD
jgi:hypothetical protein